MMSPRSPSFLNAYLVAENSMGALPVGVVRKDGNVWRILPVADPCPRSQLDQAPR